MSHRPLAMEMQGFDQFGYLRGSACYHLRLEDFPLGGWVVSFVGKRDPKHVQHIEDARQLLWDAGCVTINESDGRKF